MWRLLRLISLSFPGKTDTLKWGLDECPSTPRQRPPSL
jgi:hypothetical protein